MKHTRLEFLLVFLLFSFIPLSAFAANTLTFDEIVFFGDSLSDNGNLYAFDLGLLPKSPPYYRGRFSNGLVWSEKVAARFVEKDVTSQNFAVGGETVNLHDPFEGYLPYAFTDSLDAYYMKNLLKDKSHTLYIIWLGGNDYLIGKVEDPAKAVSAVIATLDANIENLISKGAKNFLIMNLPDLGMTPDSKAAGNQLLLSEITAMHNIALQAGILVLQAKHRNVNLHFFDINSLYTDLLKHPEVYNQKYHTHISNVTDACWAGSRTLKQLPRERDSIAAQLEKTYRANLAGNTHDKMPKNLDFTSFADDVATNPDLGSAYVAGRDFDSGVVPCADPDSYAFWDDVHPTTVVHSILTEVMVETINQYFRGK